MVGPRGTEHEKAIRTIVASWRPDLLALTGVGPIVAATVLAAWPHAGRPAADHITVLDQALRQVPERHRYGAPILVRTDRGLHQSLPGAPTRGRQ